MSDGTTSRSRKNSVNSLAISANEFYTDQTTDVHTAALMDDCSSVIAKFHYTDPTRTKSAHIVGDELNSTTRARPDPHGPARTFFAAKLSWVRAGPVGPV